RGQLWRKGLKDGLPIAFGYLAVSFSFGILATKAGLTSGESSLISLTNLTSAGQFAGITLMQTSALLMEVAATQLIINSRYFLMSAALSQKVDAQTSLIHRMIMAFGITDEIFGLSISVNGKLNPFYTYGIMSVAIPSWTLGTFLGAYCGNILPSNMISALSIALYGMLLAVIIPPAKGNIILTLLILLSMFVSFLFNVIPGLESISSGLKIVILTFVIAGGAAFLFPLKGEVANE
ncbi:AzlC family ABC transporter permease, partial [Bacillus sp. JJ1764]|uniref:AzlC family ABC transporter permease n=1 Tax=Bacillus sp. JJ1764 TaxID=3122964 RepID=UPI002FFE545F